jgi:hypothetical protein
MDSDLIPVMIDLSYAHHSRDNYDSLLFWEEKIRDMVGDSSPYYGELLLIESL